MSEARRFGFRIWGARGSLPRLTVGQERHGGNTVCVELLHPGTERVVLDAGTGIANLGDHLLAQQPSAGSVHLFISHYHWDHIMGLPFFGPIYRRGYTVHFYGLRGAQGDLREMLKVVFSASYSPIYHPDNLLGRLDIPAGGSPYAVDDLVIRTFDLPDIHPGGYMVVRVELGDQSLVYASDVELREPAVVDEFVRCCDGADLLLCNAAFSQQRYEEAVGWGHSSLEASYEVAHRARVKRLMGIHYDPLRTDVELEDVCTAGQGRYEDTSLELAREGQEVWL